MTQSAFSIIEKVSYLHTVKASIVANLLGQRPVFIWWTIHACKTSLGILFTRISSVLVSRSLCWRTLHQELMVEITPTSGHKDDSDQKIHGNWYFTFNWIMSPDGSLFIVYVCCTRVAVDHSATTSAYVGLRVSPRLFLCAPQLFAHIVFDLLGASPTHSCELKSAWLLADGSSFWCDAFISTFLFIFSLCSAINSSTLTGPYSLWFIFMMILRKRRNLSPPTGFVKKSPMISSVGQC